MKTFAIRNALQWLHRWIVPRKCRTRLFTSDRWRKPCTVSGNPNLTGRKRARADRREKKNRETEERKGNESTRRGMSGERTFLRVSSIEKRVHTIGISDGASQSSDPSIRFAIDDYNSACDLSIENLRRATDALNKGNNSKEWLPQIYSRADRDRYHCFSTVCFSVFSRPFSG